MAQEMIGHVIHYWSKIGVAGIHVTEGELKIGDTIRIKGHTSDLTQRVASMQIEGQEVEIAKAGEDIGLKVADYVREHDQVFKVTEDE